MTESNTLISATTNMPINVIDYSLNDTKTNINIKFDNEFKHIKFLIIQDTDPHKVQNQGRIEPLINEYIEIKFSKAKNEINVNINSDKKILIFVILEIDGNSQNNAFKLEISSKNTNDSSKISTPTRQEDMIRNGLAKMIKNGFKLPETKKEEFHLECPIKNENISAKIKRKK